MSRSKFTKRFNGLDALRRFSLYSRNELKPIVTNHARDRLQELDPTRPASGDALGKTLRALWADSTFHAEQKHGHMRRADLRTASGSLLEVILCAKPDRNTGRPVLATVMTMDMARSQLAFKRSSHSRPDDERDFE